MSYADANEAVEHAMVSTLNGHTANLVTENRVRIVLLPSAGNTFLAALHDAGYEVVERTDGPWAWRKARGVLKGMAPGVRSEDLIRELYEDDEP